MRPSPCSRSFLGAPASHTHPPAPGPGGPRPHSALKNPCVWHTQPLSVLQAGGRLWGSPSPLLFFFFLICPWSKQAAPSPRRPKKKRPLVRPSGAGGWGCATLTPCPTRGGSRRRGSKGRFLAGIALGLAASDECTFPAPHQTEPRSQARTPGHPPCLPLHPWAFWSTPPSVPSRRGPPAPSLCSPVHIPVPPIPRLFALQAPFLFLAFFPPH